MWKTTDSEEALLEEIRKLKKEKEELVDVLSNVIEQSCSTGLVGLDTNVDLDSMALSAYADGMTILEQYGKIEIIDEFGRRVLANWRK